jgi:hypothetical protein
MGKLWYVTAELREDTQKLEKGTEVSVYRTDIDGYLVAGVDQSGNMVKDYAEKGHLIKPNLKEVSVEQGFIDSIKKSPHNKFFLTRLEANMCLKEVNFLAEKRSMEEGLDSQESSS